MKIFKFKVCTQ